MNIPCVCAGSGEFFLLCRVLEEQLSDVLSGEFPS